MERPDAQHQDKTGCDPHAVASRTTALGLRAGPTLPYMLELYTELQLSQHHTPFSESARPYTKAKAETLKRSPTNPGLPACVVRPKA